MPNFAYTSAVQLWPFTDYLTDKGISVSQYLMQNHLPPSTLDMPDIKLSTQLVYNFIDNVSSQEELPHLFQGTLIFR